MKYLQGYTVKPYETTEVGQVYFTDGTTNDLLVNKQTCEAYGYRFDNASGTCRAFSFSPKISRNFNNIANNLLGSETNKAERGSEKVLINGNLNISRGDNRNCFATGEEHELGSRLNNASIIGGAGARTYRQGEIAIGGNSEYGAGYAQSSIVQLGSKSVSDADVDLTAQRQGEQYIEMQLNSVIGFEIFVTRFEVSGSDVGDFGYVSIKGAAICDNSGSITLTTHSTTTIATNSTIGAMVMRDTSVSSSYPSISVRCTGPSGATRGHYWSATAYLHETKSINTF